MIKVFTKKPKMQVNKSKREHYHHNECKFMAIKILSETTSYQPIFNLEKFQYIVKFKTSCILTSQTKSVLKKFQLSRMSFRNAVGKGLLTGIRRAKW